MKKILPNVLAAKRLLPQGQGAGGASGAATTLLTVGCLLAGSLTAHAQFPINEAFNHATTTNFTLGGSATLTGTAADTTIGYLRLTSANTNQAGYAILNGTFPSAKGFSVSFEYFSYGGTSTGADGLSVFMVDALGTDPTAGQFNIGAYGGSLGYAQINTFNTPRPGATNGYLGIGLDEYGNFSNPSEGRVGGPGRVAQSVALRGSAANNYPYLTGSNSLPFTLDVATPRAQPTSPDYRKAYLYVLPIKGGAGYTITIRLQHGRTVTTTTDMYTVAAPPANLRVGFAGSTGDFTNIHEIRNLAILDNPYAIDDSAQTPYNHPIAFNATTNDRGIGAELLPSTVDLDPDTPGIQQTYTIADQGTFSVDNQGVVTFTPIGTFVGDATLPYVVSDIVGKLSNPAIMTVTVTGADVASAISGPTAGLPGTPLTYQITTQNNGSEPATNVWPTLQLPLGLSLPVSPDYAYDAASGLVKFTPVTLTSGQSTLSSLTFPAPAGITNVGMMLVSSYAYPSTGFIPDPVASNNTATLQVGPVAPLPVELTRFDAAASQQAAVLTWHTATEQHNDHFAVERSVTGAEFQLIGTVRSQGNGLGAHDYSFTDRGAGQLGAAAVYYRLRQVDTDGTSTYSPVRSVRFAAPKALVTLYPNPSQGHTQLDLSNLTPASYLVQVLDLTGRVLRSQPAAAEVTTLDLVGLPQGAYVVLVQGVGVRQALSLLRN